MTDDKDKDGIKGNLRDEFDEATDKEHKKKEQKEGDPGGSGGLKSNLRDEFDEAAGEKKKDKKDKEGKKGEDS
jgi:hypothetical protein